MDATPIPNLPHKMADLQRLVESTRRRLWVRRLLLGAEAMALLMVTWLLVTAMIDLLLPLAVPLRIVAFLLGITLLAGAFWFGLLRPMLCRESPDAVACRIEATVPAMHNRLLTVLDLARRQRSAADPVNEPFEAALVDQTLDRLSQFQIAQVASPRSLLRVSALLGMMMLTAGLALQLWGERLVCSVSRILAPVADIAPLTQLTFRTQPGDVEILQGEPLELAAVIERGDAETLDVELRTMASDAAWHTYPMNRAADGRFTFTITALDQSYDYRILGGQTWSPIHHLRMVRRPTLESVQAALKMPDYMGFSGLVPIADAARILAPIGSAIEFTVSAQGDVAHATLNVKADVGRPMVRDEQGRWRGSLAVTGDASVTIELANVQGHRNAPMAPFLLIARSDEPPTIIVESPSRAVTLSKVQPMAVSARLFDDFGLARAGVQVSRDPDTFITAPRWITVFDQPVTAHTMTAQVDPVDDQAQPLQLGDALFVRIVAQDRKGWQTVSEAIRFTFQSQGGVSAQTAAQRADELSRMMGEWRNLAEKHGDIAAMTDRLLAGLPQSLRDGASRDELLNQWIEKLGDSEKQSLRELDGRLRAQREVASQLARQLESQARQAGSDGERDVLREMARQARSLASEPGDHSLTDRGAADRLRKFNAESFERQASLAAILQHLKALEQARNLPPADAAKAAQSLDDLLAQLKAIGATQELKMLTQALQEKQDALSALRQRQEELTRQTADADAKSLEAQGAKQQALDRQSVREMAQAQKLLRNDQQKGGPSLAWKPDGESSEALRIHQEARSRELDETRREASDAREQARQLAQSLKQSSRQVETAGGRSSAAGEGLRSLLASTSTKSLLKMADRARRQAQQEGDEAQPGERADPADPGLARGEQNQPQFRRGEVTSSDSPPAIDPRLAPALYRLPPQFREALLQGMNDKGPASYQKLIDAYHRQLAESVQEQTK